VTGYNLRAFDLPLLRAEFERAGVAWPLDGVPVADSFVLFKERSRYTLSTAVRRYCGRELVGAHGALADAEAALDVLEAQIVLYDLAGMSLAELDAASGGRRPDWATDCGRIRWDDAGHAVFAFGKANGQRVESNAGFAGWIMRNDFPGDVKDIVGRVLRGERVRAPAPPPPPPPVADDLTFDDIPF
jgi:DNA polymerase-3 subunit epsilon